MARSQYVDAAHVLIQYCPDEKDQTLQQAVSLLVRGEEWSESLRLAQLHGNEQLINSEVVQQLDRVSTFHHCL